MKIRIDHHSLFDIKLLDKKISIREVGHALNHNLTKVKDVVFSNSTFKTTLFYLSSALSILFLMAFVQLSDFDRIIKAVLGVAILSVNVWLLKKYNL